MKPFAERRSSSWYCDNECENCERDSRCDEDDNYLGVRWADRWSGGGADMCEKCVVANAEDPSEAMAVVEAAAAQKEREDEIEGTTLISAMLSVRNSKVREMLFNLTIVQQMMMQERSIGTWLVKMVGSEDTELRTAAVDYFKYLSKVRA